MKSNTMSDFTHLLKYLPVYKMIGNTSVSKVELQNICKKTMPDTDLHRDLSVLEPFVKEDRTYSYKIDMEILRENLAEFFAEFLPGLLSEDTIKKYVAEHFCDKILCDLADFENEEKQTYQYLYHMLQKKYEKLEADFLEQKCDLDDAHRNLADLKIELKNLKAINGDLKDVEGDIADCIKSFLTKEITVQKVEAIDAATGEKITCSSDNKKRSMALSDTPGIYSFKRPSWFTPLHAELELSKKNVSRKNARHTETILSGKLEFWKSLMKKGGSVEAKAEQADEMRRKNIEKLLASEDTNEEKYLKYMLLTPGMDRDFMKTLNGAAELGLNAKIVIELLEQPAENFNREMFEAYVSQIHKATEYNLKLELAEELIRGEWYIVSEINGSRQKYQLVPLEKIEEIKKQLQELCDVLTKPDTLCHNGTKLNETENVEDYDTQKEIYSYSDADLFDETDLFTESDEEKTMAFSEEINEKNNSYYDDFRF